MQLSPAALPPSLTLSLTPASSSATGEAVPPSLLSLLLRHKVPSTLSLSRCSPSLVAHPLSLTPATSTATRGGNRWVLVISLSLRPVKALSLSSTGGKWPLSPQIRTFWILVAPQFS
jgi:hypothetical protein